MSNALMGYPEALSNYDAVDLAFSPRKTSPKESFAFPGHKDRQRSVAITWIAHSLDGIEQQVNEYEFAKRKILELFEAKRTLYFSDIAKELDLDISVIVSICKELARAGKIHAQAS